MFDGTTFHRVVKGFVVQTGSLDTRGPLQREAAEARAAAAAGVQRRQTREGDRVDGARRRSGERARTSFFIVTGDASSLDGKYTIFGRVVDGLPVVEAIEQTPVTGEAPVSRIELKQARVTK